MRRPFNDDNGSLDFLDILAIVSLSLQMQGVISQDIDPDRLRLQRIERKLDYLLETITSQPTKTQSCEGNTSNASKRP